MRKKGNKVSSITTTMIRLRRWLSDEEQLSACTEARLAAKYEQRCNEVAVDTQRIELCELKTFLRFCCTKGWLKQSPAEKIEAVGRRKYGKAQLRVGEAQRFAQVAVPLARNGDEAAVAALVMLYLGLRPGEVRCRMVRDVDKTQSGMVLLWIDKGKTKAARRRMEVPEPLAALLLKQAKGKLPTAYLFPSSADKGYRTATWLRRAVIRLCRKALVPTVPPHGLRGTWATLAEEAGAVGHLVAQQLGHETHRTTEQHYLADGTTQRAASQRATKVLVVSDSDGSVELGQADASSTGPSDPQTHERPPVSTGGL